MVDNFESYTEYNLYVRYTKFFLSNVKLYIFSTTEMSGFFALKILIVKGIS